MQDRLNSALPGGRLTRFGQFTKNIFFACHSSLALVCFLLTLSQSLSSLTGINRGSDWLMFRRGWFRELAVNCGLDMELLMRSRIFGVSSVDRRNQLRFPQQRTRIVASEKIAIFICFFIAWQSHICNLHIRLSILPFFYS